MVAEHIQTALSIDKSAWKKVTLGEVVKEVRETAKDPVAEGLERVIGLEHLESESLHIKSWGSIADATTFTKKFRKGQMLFGRRRAYLRKAALATFDGICSGDITVLEAKNGLIPELLPFLIQNDKFFELAIKNSAGSLSPRAKFNDFADYEFLLPPKDQQAQIAELLWAGDEMIEKSHSLISSLSLAMSAYKKETFTQDGFETKGIMDIASVKRGRFSPRPRNDPRYFGGHIPFIQTSEVIEAKKYINRYSRTLNDEGLAVSKMFHQGTIAMAIAGTYVGSCGILNFDSAFTDSIIGIQSKQDIISQSYLFYYLRFYEKAIDALATEVAQRNLSLESFKNFSVRFPKSLIDQENIASQLDQFESAIGSNETQHSNAKFLQKSLINQFF